MSSDFIKENIKKKPINKSKIGKRIILTVVSAIIFGIIASLIILVLEPFMAKITNINAPTEKPTPVVLPVDEKTPEEMLSEFMIQENERSEEQLEDYVPVELPLNDDQIKEILSKINLDVTSYKQMTTSIAVYAKELEKYTVKIDSSSSSVDWLNTTNSSVNTSSGLIIASNNLEVLILADSSQIKSDSTIKVSFNNYVTVDAEVKGKDFNTTLAVLSVQKEKLPKSMDIEAYIPKLSNSNGIYVGMPVIAIGSPKGIYGSLGYGIIDAPKQSVVQIDETASAFMTDIEGSAVSSGVLFNLQGQVIGVITNSVKHPTGEKFVVAYGITELKDRIEKMSNEVELNYIGISAVDVINSIHTEQGLPLGAFVTDIQMDSPAMMSGIQKGDIIVGVDEMEFTDFSSYISYINQKHVGDEIIIKAMRKSQDSYTEIEFKVVIKGR